MSNKPKKVYKKPKLRVYGPMEQLTHAMWWGLYPDHLGNLDPKPPDWWMKKDMMMVMS